jgi:TfoX/Sxy family transcriptional regulator of competence genes
MATWFPHLRELIEEGSTGLPGVAPRRMFGCDAFFAFGNIYALIWREGRIALRMPASEAFEELRALPGADSWSVGSGKTMAGWVLVPEDFHDEPELLGKWIRRAYDFAARIPPKQPKSRAKAAPKAAAKTLSAKKAPKAAAAKEPVPRAPARTKRPEAKAASGAKKAARPASRRNPGPGRVR